MKVQSFRCRIRFLMGLVSILVAAQAYAMGKGGGSSQPPHYEPGRPGLTRCQANDAGWEEHSGGHASCGECLARHGKCVESCYNVGYSCTVEGQDRYGVRTTFEASSDFSETDARERALDRCTYGGGANCHVQDCNQNEKQVSSRRC